MKNIVFVLFTGFLLASTVRPANSQTWEAFLEKHVDNLNNAVNVPGLSHQYSDEAIQEKRSEMLSLIYNNHRKLYQESTGKFDPLKYPTHTVNGKNERAHLNAVLSLGTDKEKQNARNLLYNSMLFTGIGYDFTSFYTAGYILNLKPEVFTPDKERDLREFYTENTAMKNPLVRGQARSSRKAILSPMKKPVPSLPGISGCPIHSCKHVPKQVGTKMKSALMILVPPGESWILPMRKQSSGMFIPTVTTR